MKIKSIKKIGSGRVRNLSVLKNHTFITESGIVTHNCDAGNANSILAMQSIMEGKPYYFKLNNEIVYPAPGFNIIATANTKGKGSDDGRYIGTNVLNEAFLERFAVTLEQEYPAMRTELKIIHNIMKSLDCLNEAFANNLVKWADAVRRTFDAGGVDETITTRRIVHVIRAYSIFKKESKAVELCCNRFDVNTKNAFVDLFNKIAEEPIAPATEKMSEEEAMEYNKEISF